MKKMYRVGIATLIACIFIALTIRCGFDSDYEDTDPISFVSLYHASPNGPDLDIVVDDMKINTVPFTYGLYTDYLRFSSGSRTLKLGPYGGSTFTIDTVLGIEPDKHFSIFVIDEFERASVMMLFDDPALPATGNAKVRFINLSPDSEPVQLKIKGEPLPLTIVQSFAVASTFMDVEAKTYIFEILSGGVVVEDLPNTQLQSGRFYTIVVRGYATPPTGNTNGLSAQIINN